jgi:inorganic pyrophosphatase
MVVEIPRWTNAKMEISKGDIFNPIKQDVKNGKLRFVDNVFPYKGYIWNYGALPQTWEDPHHVDAGTGCKGDNDPVDVCDLSSRVHKRGSVVPVKVLGVLGLIDEGETDWKIMAIDVSDPMADVLNDIEDVEKHMPGYLRATRDWFRRYKMPTGKPPNEFAFNGEFKDKKFSLELIAETHNQWKALVAKDTDSGGIMCENVSVAGSPYLITREEAKTHLDKATPFTPTSNGDEPGGESGEKWHFPAN